MAPFFRRLPPPPPLIGRLLVVNYSACAIAIGYGVIFGFAPAVVIGILGLPVFWGMQRLGAG